MLYHLIIAVAVVGGIGAGSRILIYGISIIIRTLLDAQNRPSPEAATVGTERRLVKGVVVTILGGELTALGFLMVYRTVIHLA